MAKKKHSWHCGNCGSSLTSFKHGKGTKYLYCPSCHYVVAFYNKGIGAVIGGAIGSVIPGAGTTIGALVGSGAEKLLTSRKAKKEPDSLTGSQRQYIVSDSKDKPNYGERIINKELYGA